MHLVGKCACFGLSLVTGCSYLGVPTLCTSTVHTPRTSYVWFDARSNIPIGAPRTHGNQTAITTSTRTYVCVSRAWAYIPDGRFAACLLTIYTYTKYSCVFLRLEYTTSPHCISVCFLLFFLSSRDRRVQGSPCALPKCAILREPIIEQPGAVRHLGATPPIKSHCIKKDFNTTTAQIPTAIPISRHRATLSLHTPPSPSFSTPSAPPPPFLTADLSLTTPLHPTGQPSQRSHLRMGLGHAMRSSR